MDLITILQGFLHEYLRETSYKPTTIYLSVKTFSKVCQEIEKRWLSEPKRGYTRFAYDGIPVEFDQFIKDNEIIFYKKLTLGLKKGLTFVQVTPGVRTEYRRFVFENEPETEILRPTFRLIELGLD